MKYLNTKLKRFLRRLFVGRRDDDDDASNCKFRQKRVKKIYPTAADDDAHCKMSSIFPRLPAIFPKWLSGVELLLEHSPEKDFTYQDLKLLTNNFSQENLFGPTQFGKLYAGRIPDGWKGMEAQDVTVKTWELDTDPTPVEWECSCRSVKLTDLLYRMISEINFLSQPEMESHPNLATVKGYCFEENKFGVVYSVKPRSTIRRFAEYGPFTWARRIEVALGLARLLEFLHVHQPQFLVRNLAAAHIMLDKDWNPILVDCGMLVGGGFGDVRKSGRGGPLGISGYTDVCLMISDEWTAKSDVYAFGVILLELILKSRFDGEKWKGYELGELGPLLYHHAVPIYGESRTSFANWTNFGKDRTFVYDADGPVITKLAIQCVEDHRDARPTMTEIVGELEKLQVCKEWKMVAGSELKKLQCTGGQEMVIADDGRVVPSPAAVQPLS